MSSLAASDNVKEDLQRVEARATQCIELVSAEDRTDVREYRQLVMLRTDITHRLIEIQTEVAELHADRATRTAETHANEVRALRENQIREGQVQFRVGRAAAWWFASVLSLYILLGVPLGQPTDGSGAWVVADNLRDYLARVAGTIPQQCVETGTSINTQVKPIADNTPLFVQWVQPEPSAESNGTRCGWREGKWKSDTSWFRSVVVHLFAAISVDVGTIQKISLLFLIVAFQDLARIRRERDFAAEIVRDPVFPNGLTADLEPERRLSLFPRRVLTVARWTDSGDPYLVLRNEICRLCDDLNAVREHTGTMALRLLDYIRDILTAGLVTDKVDALAERADRMTTSYREQLFERFWRIDYYVWLLPTVGFLGTIYGISQSLLQAKGIFSENTNSGGEGDSGGARSQFGEVVDALGIAFDTTAFALVLLAILLWSVKRTERWVRIFCEESLRIVQERLFTKLRDRDTRSDVGLVAEAHALIDVLAPDVRTEDGDEVEET